MQLSEASSPLFLSSCEPGSSTNRRQKPLSEWDRSEVHMVINPLGLFAPACQKSGRSFKSPVFQHTGCPNIAELLCAGTKCKSKQVENIQSWHFALCPAKAHPSTLQPPPSLRTLSEGPRKECPRFANTWTRKCCFGQGETSGLEGGWRPLKDSCGIFQNKSFLKSPKVGGFPEDTAKTHHPFSWWGGEVQKGL